MELSKLSILNFRNLVSAQIEPINSFNFFSGENGSGKTSILEAIHFLSHGRSFRNVGIKPLINHGCRSFILNSMIIDNLTLKKNIGIERFEKSVKGRINGIDISKVSQITELLPVIVFHPGSFGLLTESPASRRAFLDWGLFFADPCFKLEWRKYQLALRQRNAALRRRLPKKDIQCWDSQLVEHGEYLSKSRESYLHIIQQSIPELCEQLGSKLVLEFKYRKGWQSGGSLKDLLVEQIERDLVAGYTFSGPHRADFSVDFNGNSVAKFASRGQIKLITVLLKLAQADYFVKHSNSTCLLLLDDIASEFDMGSLSLVMDVVAKLGLQVFLTSVTTGSYEQLNLRDSAMFHVEHGTVDRVL